MSEDLSLFYRQFPLMNFNKKEHTFLNMNIIGLNDELYPKSRKASPIEKNSPMHDKEEIACLKNANIDITLVELPIFNVTNIFRASNNVRLLLCAIVESNAEVFSCVVYKNIRMSPDEAGKIFTSTIKTDLFVTLPVKNRQIQINTNKFVFVHISNDFIYLSKDIPIRTWKYLARKMKLDK